MATIIDLPPELFRTSLLNYLRPNMTIPVLEKLMVEDIKHCCKAHRFVISCGSARLGVPHFTRSCVWIGLAVV